MEIVRPNQDIQIVRPSQVCKMLQISRATLWRRTKTENFPKSISLGGGTAVGYIKSEVEQWILSQRKKAT